MTVLPAYEWAKPLTENRPMSEMKRIALAARPEGAPKESDFSLETGPVPSPGEGEMLVRVIWQSLDPYMRGRMDGGKSYAAPVEIGETMEAGCVGEVMESRNGRFAEGDIVVGRFGWTTHAISDGAGVRKVDPSVAPIQTALGVLGMPGFTAWAGLNVHGRPESGETLAVGAATGAVGSLVGQLGKAKGLCTVGIAGGPEKCAYAVDELGYDACLDHRAHDDASSLRKAIAVEAKDGIDVYFENVGAKTTEAVMPLMNDFGRIPVCGMIGWYNSGGLGLGAADGGNLAPMFWRSILVKRLSVRGFIIFDHDDLYPQFLEEVAPMVADGRVRYRETIAEGIEAGPKAFIGLLQGENFGKQLVRIGEE